MWPEVVWRGLIFFIASLLLLVVTTRWTSWQGAPGWEATLDTLAQNQIAVFKAPSGGWRPPRGG